MKITWVPTRGKGHIDLNRPNIFYALGIRGGGKSSLLETLASKYLDMGAKVVDLFASMDGENLAWLRSPHVKEGKRVVLLRGDLTEVKSDQVNIAASKFKLSDLMKGEIFISASPLYSCPDEEFDAVNHIIDELWKRHQWKIPIFLVVREAANLFYSRVKVSKNQSIAKNEVIYLLRESRHVGLALGLDSIRHRAVDIDVRTLADYLLIKNVGMHGLDDSLNWIYSVFDPFQMRQMSPKMFVVVDRHGHLGFGTFSYPPWHKEEDENIMEKVGVRVKYFHPAADGDQTKGFIAEALDALPAEPDAGDVATWIKDEKHQQLTPGTVGQHLRKMGFHSDLVFKDGSMKRVIKKNP